MERRLRCHFFFHNMNMKVDQFVKGCKDRKLFTEKKTTEPIRPHSVPCRHWEKVAVDRFGPMPSSNHVVVVQDLASRFPAAKVVSSSKASKVIPALEQIYDAYGKPEKQLSDSGNGHVCKGKEHYTREDSTNAPICKPCSNLHEIGWENNENSSI